MRTIGNRRRSAFTRSRAWMNAFSCPATPWAAGYFSRDPTSGRFSIVVIFGLQN
jgi:hypothetical protein